MRQTPGTAKHWILRVAVPVWMMGMSPAALGQVTTTTYVLEDVWLLPDISHPSSSAQQMTGSFEWTYQYGDFENGSGQFTDVSFPWYNPGLEELNVTVEVSSIEFSLIGNYHDLGLDLTLFLIEPLTPSQPSAINTVVSMFDIQNGVSYQGHVVSGNIVPIPNACPWDLDAGGSVGITDLLALLTAWGTDLVGPPDFDGDGTVGILDLLALLANWGPCP